MDAVFQLIPNVKGIPAELAAQLDTLSLRAQPLDPSAADGPLSGWFRLESDNAQTVQQALRILQDRADVQAAYIKPAEGPPD